MKIACEVIEDLLPLYIDDVCSEESVALVEEHLMECSICSEKLKAQKSELIVEDSIIKENLKSKDPFKKIKKFQAIKFIVLFIVLPLILYFSFVELSGDGVGFSALVGKYKAGRVLSHIEKGRFEKAAEYMSFNGGKYRDIANKEEARNQWILGMQELKNSGIEIVSHRDNRFKTDDRFTLGGAVITVKYDNRKYDFNLTISTNTGKVEPSILSPYYPGEFRGPTAVEKMLIQKISDVIYTYDAG